MRRALISIALLTATACGGSDDHPHYAVAPKPPNDALIVGSYERRPPAGTTAIQFLRDGSVKLAKDKSKLGGAEVLATGTWTLDKDQLTILYTEGECAQDGPGTYKIVLSKLGVHFQKVDDACETRSHIDGEVWRRIAGDGQ